MNLRENSFVSLRVTVRDTKHARHGALTYLNEASVLYNLRTRYTQQFIYVSMLVCVLRENRYVTLRVTCYVIQNM